MGEFADDDFLTGIDRLDFDQEAEREDAWLYYDFPAEYAEPEDYGDAPPTAEDADEFDTLYAEMGGEG